MDDPLIAAALRFISSHLREPIGVDHIAEGVEVSRRTLETRFRRSMDTPIAAEVRRPRIEHAKRILAGQATMREIARETGLGTSKQLSQIFRRELDTTPGDYRKQSRGQTSGRK